jgi:PST family polysaccharide transporter
MTNRRGAMREVPARAGHLGRHGGLASPYLWATIERIARQGGWLVFFVLLAPILGPRDYGLFTIALCGIAVVETLFCDGVVGLLVGLERVEDGHLSTAFVTTAGAGMIVSVLLSVVAGFVARMFDTASLGDMFQSLALLPLLSALTAVPIALLRRRQRFLPLALSAIVGVAVGGGVGLSLALVGGGAWSLVAQIVTQRFVEIAILWGGAGRLVGLRWSRTHFAELAAAAQPGALVPALAMFGRQAPRFVVGLILGPIGAGLYMLGAQLLEALVDIFLVPMTLLARAPEFSLFASRLRRASTIAFPSAIGSAALLVVMLPALFDPQWWQAVRPAQILILAALPAILTQARRAVLSMQGRGSVEAGAQGAEALLGVLAVAIAAPFGLSALAVALVLQGTFCALVSLWPLGRLRPGLGTLAGAIVPPVAAALVAGGTLLILQSALGPAVPPALAITLLLACGALAYGLALGVPRGWKSAKKPFEA